MFLPWQLYLGLGAAVAGGAWYLSNTRDPNRPAGSRELIHPPPKSRRDELLEARDGVRRQLEILKSPSRASDYTSFSTDAERRLRDILENIETELQESPRG